MNVIKTTNPSRWAHRVHDPFYTSKGWIKFRKVYFMEFPNCVDCLKEGRVTDAIILDHIHQRSLGGPDFPDRDGLRGLCRHHDSKRQSQQSKNARR
jgi:5-methylcytosine-specific restriction protein A